MTHRLALLIRQGFRLFSLLALLLLPSSGHADTTTVKILIDEFAVDGPPDPTKWFTPDGKQGPTVQNGMLRCAATSGKRCELQSVETFTHVVLQTELKSSFLKPHATETDSSIGLENFVDGCHYGVLLKGNGHLDLLRSIPGPGGTCTVDPEKQKSIQIPNWNTIRVGPKVLMTLVVGPKGVVLTVSSGADDDLKIGSAAYRGEAESNFPLRVRINVDCQERFPDDPLCTSDADEVYKLKYIRAVQIPW